MARRKAKKRESFFQGYKQLIRDADAATKRTWIRWTARAALISVMIPAGVWGMLRLERAVMLAPGQLFPPKIVLVDVPADLEVVMREALSGFASVPWSDPTLCTDIAAALERTGWVRSVSDVHRYPDRRVEIRCRYRSPLALVQTDSGFYLVDEDCVRLPGRYANDPGLKLIQGVRSGVPAAGEVWQAPELEAATQLLKLILREAFCDQMTAVLVQNFGGRVDPHGAEVELATNRTGGRIIWGSPPGAEIEENNVLQKLELLRNNYRRFGHVDANRGVIDVSVHPDRIISPT